MKYQLLKSFYYLNKEEFEKEYESRVNSPAAINIDFKIHDNAAFILVTPDICNLISGIYRLNSAIDKLLNSVPKSAVKMYERNCLIDEVMLTNDIEGISSTRKEIKNILSDINKEETKNKRFHGLVKKYLMFLNDTAPNEISTPGDIRKLYDELVLDEIPDSLKPDGVLFRKGAVDVISSTQQVKHSNNMSEEKIISCLTSALNIMKDNDIEILIRISLFHYIFGYIHPFYDGNGRTARFISSIELSKNLGPLIAYRLSHSIKNNRSYYYKAFDICNDIRNKGDLTPFVIMFLKMIFNAEKHLYEKLTEYYSQLRHYHSLLSGLNNNQSSIIFILIQAALFSHDSLDREELALNAELSYQTVTKELNTMISSGAPIIVEKSGHSFLYKVDLDKIEDYLTEK